MSNSSERPPSHLPLIPLKEIVIFPFSITPLYIIRERSLAALDQAMMTDRRVFLVTQRSPEDEEPTEEQLYDVGVAAEVTQAIRLQDGTAKILVEGHFIARLDQALHEMEYSVAEHTPLDIDTQRTKRTQALLRTVYREFERYCSMSDRAPHDILDSLRQFDDAAHTAHTVANIANLKIEHKQMVLATPALDDKLYLVSKLLKEENELLSLESKIINQVKSGISKSQREYFLNEQLKAIERELGVSNDDDLELDELREQIEDSGMPHAAREKAERELSRLSRMQPYSPEATVSRTYIEWLLDVPWEKFSEDRPSLRVAEQILERDHYGLSKIKERILEFLAVRQRVQEMKSPVLCFVGPPGVGKTSLGRSVATAMNREFARVSLGGVRDEAEIRGHRRTYIGSMPGKIVQMLTKTETMNPVILLDEIDKMSSDFRGDPASALLEALDPEQNVNFNDHYLEVDLDLSKVMFITTANTLDGIPHALLDRMETIRLPGYTRLEKLAIAKRYLIPKQMKEHGLAPSELTWPRKGLDSALDGYTREAGVRELNRCLATICRKSARARQLGDEKGRVSVSPKMVADRLGPAKYSEPERARSGGEVGVATGLAWTSVGGEILPAEVILMPGKGNLELTGKLGEVMRESAKASLSYIRARHKQFDLEPDFYKTLDIHIHLPEGAIPKDGPSAGVTMTTALVSALTGKPVRSDLAMTGEITLRGKTLKIGGLKEKALAAHRSKFKTVLIPKDNEPDLAELDAEVKRAVEFVCVESIEDVLKHALLDPASKKKSAGGRQAKPGKRAPRKPANQPAAAR